MIRVRYLRSFDKTFESLPFGDQEKTKEATNQLLDYFSGGAKPLGLGLRKLRGDAWEIRASLNIRILFVLTKQLATFVIVGNHNDIHRYLRKN